MSAQFRAHLAFHQAGARTEGVADPVAGRALVPVLLARHAELAALRHDFPVVLVDGDDGGVRSLSGLVDGALRAIAPAGSAGERTRQLVLAAERAIRRAIAGGGSLGTLASRWATAAAQLAGGDRAVAAELARAWAAIGVDGTLVDCGAGVGVRLAHHLWRSAQKARLRRLRALVDRLRRGLGDILRAHHLASPAGRSADRLAASFGAADGAVIDFAALSRVLTRTAAGPMPEGRARRIREALAALDADELVVADDAGLAGFVFDSAAAVDQAHRARLPRMRRLARAIAVAQLEVEGLYVEARHDRLLDRLFERELRGGDRALFPDELVTIDAARAARGEGARLLELLSTGSTAKVVVELAELGPRPPDDAGLGLGVRGDRLAAMAMAQGDVFVVQAPAAALYPLADRVAAALAGPHAALVSVFSGATAHAALPPFLLAGAALEGRSFPAFTFDPSAGDDWAARFSLAGNPQPERAWPLHRLEYADAAEQRATIEVAFTHADFAACDRNQAAHLAAVTGGGTEALAPVAEVVAPGRGAGGALRVPYVLLADDAGEVTRVLVDEPLMAETRAVATAWRSLQELAGIASSHVERALARERLAWADRERATPPIAPEPPLPTVPVAAAPAAEAAPARADGEPYIETARCSTCNECTRLNDRMFAYNANQQAFIKDVTAGTFAQLVQAAESCQLSIIHPGKPRNPNEPGLDELVERARPFQ
jgi:hypothetical protein